MTVQNSSMFTYYTTKGLLGTLGKDENSTTTLRQNVKRIRRQFNQSMNKRLEFVRSS